MKKPWSNFISKSKRAEIVASLFAFPHVSSGESQERLEHNEKVFLTFIPTFNEPTLITHVVYRKKMTSAKLIGFRG